MWMDVPLSTREKIGSQLSSDKERKAEVLRVISTEHPHLTWEQVSDALYQLEGGEYHHVLERVQSLFPTGEYLSPSLLHTYLFILQSAIVLVLHIDIPLLVPMVYSHSCNFPTNDQFLLLRFYLSHFSVHMLSCSH